MLRVSMARTSSALLGLFACLVFAAGCGSDATREPKVFEIEDRAPGARAPVTTACDEVDPLRCLLPWPSSRFLAADPTRETGVRLEVDPSGLSAPDETTTLAYADGFSRVTPIAFAFEGRLAQPSGDDVLLLMAEPGDPRYGSKVPLRYALTESEDGAPEQTLLVAFPREPLQPNAEYVAIVQNTLRAEDDSTLVATRGTQVALGLAAPTSDAEADVAGYEAPLRALLAAQGIDPAHILRQSSFVTRSRANPVAWLKSTVASSIAAVKAGGVSVAIDSVEGSGDPNIAVVVEGRLVGLPDFVEDDTRLSLGDDGLPREIGKREAPFRVMVPAGTGDYRFVMFGHGMAGSFHDKAFDTQLAALGIAKVGIDFYGWNQAELIPTFLSFMRVFTGTHRSTARLIQAVSDGAAIQEALSGALGEALSAESVGGQDNPAKGRTIDTSVPVWTGGSLGGTAGMVYAIAHPDIHHAVLNVPGAAWSHFVTQSSLYDLIASLLADDVGGNIDLMHAAVMAQTNLDGTDGAIWAAELIDTPKTFLIQESVGDPVLPNIGSEMVAVSTGALHVGVPIEVVPALSLASEAVGKTGFTQFKVAGVDDLDIHGFADRDTPAGAAARGQIDAFLQSVWAGAPRIDVPAGCLAAHADGSCDFSMDP